MIHPATRQASHAALERFLDSLDSPFREIAALDGEQSGAGTWDFGSLRSGHGSNSGTRRRQKRSEVHRAADLDRRDTNPNRAPGAIAKRGTLTTARHAIPAEI